MKISKKWNVGDDIDLKRTFKIKFPFVKLDENGFLKMYNLHVKIDIVKLQGNYADIGKRIRNDKNMSISKSIKYVLGSDIVTLDSVANENIIHGIENINGSNISIASFGDDRYGYGVIIDVIYDIAENFLESEFPENARPEIFEISIKLK